MSKQLRKVISDSENKKLPDMKQVMQQDVLKMQGVSSRLQIKEQIKEEQRKRIAQPVLPVTNSKRLSKPVCNPEFISASTGAGRMSKSSVREMKREDFGKKAEDVFGDIGKSGSDDGFDFLR